MFKSLTIKQSLLMHIEKNNQNYHNLTFKMLLPNVISKYLREYSTTESKESVYSTRQLDSTLSCIVDGDVNLFFVVSTVVLLIILITTAFVILWRKKNGIIKRMSCLGICVSQFATSFITNLSV